MSTGPMVVVKKGGFLTALVSGIFGTVIVLIVCGAGLGWYGLNVLDRKSTDIISAGRDVVAALPQLRESLPLIAEGFDDRRAPEYRDLLKTAVTIKSRGGHGCQAVVEATNNGPETVTLLTGRVVITDADGVPHEHSTYIASPFSLDEEDWRGPLLPGSTRRFSVDFHVANSATGGELEITDLRLWNRAAAKKAATSAPAQAPNAGSPDVD